MASELRLLISDEDPDRRVTTRRAALKTHRLGQVNVVGEVGYGTKAVSLALDTRPDVILMSVEEPVGRALETAEALANVLPNTPLIVYSTEISPEAIRRAMLMGARDYISHPVQPDELDTAINTVLEQEERRQMRLAGQLLNQLGRGTVVTVTGGKGGIGKTVVSVNLALALWRETGMSVAIFDADTEFGDVATMLDITPTRTVADVLPILDRLDRHSILEYLTEHESSVEVLAASDSEDAWADFTSEGVKKIIDLLAQVYDFVVIDTAGSFGPLVRACVESSTLSLVITSGEVSSIRNTALALRRLESWEIPRDRYKVVLNRPTRSNGVQIEELKELMNQDIFWQVPYDRQIPSSVQLGQPVVLFEDSSDAARNLLSLSRMIAGTKKPLVKREKKSPFKSLIKR